MSAVAASQGAAGLSIGNAVGSNITNVALVLGATLVIGASLNKAADVLRTMNERKITQIFVLDDGRPAGIIHMHDLLKSGLA